MDYSYDMRKQVVAYVAGGGIACLTIICRILNGLTIGQALDTIKAAEIAIA